MKIMKIRSLGPDGPQVSVVGLGGMLLSITGRPPEDQSLRVIDSALDFGISLFETSDAYAMDDNELGHNEKLITRGLEGQRDKVTLVTTFGLRRPGGAWTVDSSPEYLVESVERSLRNQAVSALDVALLYAADKKIPYEESVGTLFRLKEQGKIQHVGVCNADVPLIKRAESVGPIQVVQNRWHPLAREVEKNGVLEHCAQTGKAFLAYSPFGGTLGAPTLTTLGKLSDQARRRRLSPYQLVLAWMINKTSTTFTIAGARRSESIEDSAGAGAVEFDVDAVRAVENTIPTA